MNPRSLLLGFITVFWGAVPDATGYRVLIGPKSKAYTRAVDVGDVTEARIEDVDLTRKNYVAVVAFNTFGDSPPSNEKTAGKPVKPVLKSLVVGQ